MKKESYLNLVFVLFIITGSFAVFFLLYYADEPKKPDWHMIETQAMCDECYRNATRCFSECDDHTLFDEAIQESSTDKCSMIDEKEACLNSVMYDRAVQSHNISECEKINDTSMVETCRELVTWSNAILMDNPEICKTLKDATGCRDDVLRQRAVRNNNISICDSCTNIENCRQAFSVPSVEPEPKITSEPSCTEVCDLKFRVCEKWC